MTVRRILFGLLALGFAPGAMAHGFGRLYNLPVPFWLYAWGAGCALLLSFVVIGYFAGASAARTPLPRESEVTPRASMFTRTLSVFLLVLCIATGLYGTRDPYRNFSMTFFWILFVLGFLYLSALVGNFWTAINPWRVLSERFEGRVRYPERLGVWPALGLYLGFIAFELFNHGHPSTLGAMLAGYTLLNIAGAWLFGAAAWFQHCEFFSVMFRMIARLSPLRRRALHGIVDERPRDFSELTFALALLSTTAFDGLRAMQWWVSLFWNSPTLEAWVGNKPAFSYAALRSWYIGWETFWLLASPFVYLGVYLVFIALAKLVTRSPRGVRELALDFGFTLLPIALVYNITHYWTLILTQGVQIASLVSDPFGFGWNLFGTANRWRAPILPPMGVVWHTQVGLILLGHILSVYCAHLVALRIFQTRREAARSQWPMLCLMVAFTVAGLWILAQPLTQLLMR